MTLEQFCEEHSLEYPQDDRKFTIKAASFDEAALFYAMTPEEDQRLGCIGHVRMDFGHRGQEFWHTWWPRGPEELNSPEFKAELQEVVDELRTSILKDLAGMTKYCWGHGGEVGGWPANYGYILMDKLPDTHKARWFAGAALNTAEQSMNSVMSTVLSRLNAFLDSELEQVLCFDSAINAEDFASKKSAIFLILPEEDPSKNFMAGLMIQTLSRELFAVADENGGKLKNRVVLFCDELGTMPAFDILPLFSAGRSRKLTLVPIIQSLAQLEKNYGREGAEIIQDNVQDTIFGGFAPNSQTAEVLSKALGSRTVMSGYISKGKSDPSQTIQMMERPLMTPDELKSIPKGHFIVMKTGTHPMRTRLRLFLEWGITFGDPYSIPEKTARPVAYASKQELELAIMRRHHVWMPAASGAAPASGKAAAGREPCPKTGQPGDEPPDGQKSLRP